MSGPSWPPGIGILAAPGRQGDGRDLTEYQSAYLAEMRNAYRRNKTRSMTWPAWTFPWSATAPARTVTGSCWPRSDPFGATYRGERT